MDRKTIDKHFRALERALATQRLPDGEGGARLARAGEFMLMDVAGGHPRFKHAGSRNYVALVRGKVVLGDGVSPFEKHAFPEY
jgi:hypothetical protein